MAATYSELLKKSASLHRVLLTIRQVEPGRILLAELADVTRQLKQIESGIAQIRK